MWHYYNHVRQTDGFSTEIYFTPESRWDTENPWIGEKDRISHSWEPDRADILFLAGLDWLALTERRREKPPAPVINLIQGVRHAAPDALRHHFPRHRAIRICVSEEVGERLRAIPSVCGPIFVIPNGIDVGEFQWKNNHSGDDSEVDLLIIGIKHVLHTGCSGVSSAIFLPWQIGHFTSIVIYPTPFGGPNSLIA